MHPSLPEKSVLGDQDSNWRDEVVTPVKETLWRPSHFHSAFTIYLAH